MKSSIGKILTLAFFSGFLFYFSQIPVHAQKAAERWVCLATPQKDGKPLWCADSSAGCSGEGVLVHRVRLFVKPGYTVLPSAKTFIIECVGGTGGIPQTCTTGDQNADDYVYGKWEPETQSCAAGTMGDPDKSGLGAKRCCQDDPTKCQTLTQAATNLSTMNTSMGYKMEGLFLNGKGNPVNPPSPVMSMGNGQLQPYEWQSFTTHEQGRNWKALNYWAGADAANGAGGGDQQGTFTFDTAEKNCVKIFWDPYGRVFDSQTLEPIQGASVSLYKQEGTDWVFVDPKKQVNKLENPYTTSVKGYYSFSPGDGDYKFTAVPQIVVDKAQVQANYSKVYRKVYAIDTTDVIHEEGTVEYRDVAVATQNTNRQPDFTDLFLETTADGGLHMVGETIHPLTKILINVSKFSTTDEGETPTPVSTRMIERSADVDGKFNITVDQSEFVKNEDYIEGFTGVTLEKVDLTLVAKKKDGIMDRIMAFIEQLIPGVQAQAKTKSYRFEPIPQYLEGFAYDSYGKPIPNAVVGIYLTYAKGASAIITADERGYFRFTSNQLPNSPYEIKYTTANGQTIKTATSVFLAQNQKYITENKINPYVSAATANLTVTATRPAMGNPALVAAQTNPEAVAKALSGQESSAGSAASGKSGVNGQNGQKTSATTGPAGTAGISNPFILIVVLLVILFGGVAAGILLYMKNKQPQVSPPQW